MVGSNFVAQARAPVADAVGIIVQEGVTYSPEHFATTIWQCESGADCLDTSRGIVISTPVIARRGELELSTSPLDPQELRYWLLFWDKLNFPLLSGIHIELCGEGEYLQQAGVLDRRKVRDVNITIDDPETDPPEEQFQYHFMRAFHDLDASEPGRWSVATGKRSIQLDEDYERAGRGVLVRLHRALPVPHKDVALEDLLNFKEKRSAELLALRHHLEAVYQRVIAAPDSALAVNTEIEALDFALTDYLKSTRGSVVKKWVPTSIDADLQLLTGVNAAVAAFNAGFPLLQSALSGAAATMAVSASYSLKGLKRENGVPWRYVASYLDEVF